MNDKQKSGWYFLLSEVFEGEGNEDAALLNYKKYFDLITASGFPINATYSTFYGLRAESRNDLAFADRAYRNSIKDMSTMPNLPPFTPARNFAERRALAIAAAISEYVVTGQHVKALDYAERALDLAVQLPFVQYHAANVLGTMGQKERSLQILQDVRDTPGIHAELRQAVAKSMRTIERGRG